MQCLCQSAYTSYEIIATFRELEQIMFHVSFHKKPRKIKEHEFISTCFDALQRDELRELVKFSCCQTTPGPLPKYILNRNGKYYFNPDVNNDDDTHYWSQYRDDYIAYQSHV